MIYCALAVSIAEERWSEGLSFSASNITDPRPSDANKPPSLPIMVAV